MMRCLVTGGSGFIGTNLINVLMDKASELLNVDIKEPKIKSHIKYWKKVDILHANDLFDVFRAFNPTHVVHLAARADTDGTKLEEYVSNTDGTANVLAAIQATKSIQKVIITSSQFVNQYAGAPQHDEDYAPHTIYGESKVITEQLTRNAGLNCMWIIIRPTNVWGPWHPRYPFEFWRVLAKGRYIHPGGKRVIRSYGYVNNVVYQIVKMLDSANQNISGSVYYVGDNPIDLLEWVNGFSVELKGSKVVVVPRFVVKVLGVVGDIVCKFGIKSPITSSRYKSMTTSNDAPMEKTITEFGKPPYSLAEGISETVKWISEIHPELLNKKNNRCARQ